MAKKAIYPGSFDPVTNGHIDIIERASKIFDEVIVAVAVNQEKHPFFTIGERVEMLSEVCKHLPNVTVDEFDGLLVRYGEAQGASVIIRGLRPLSDFEFEFEMALMNRRLDGDIETVFMIANMDYSYLRASTIKEVVRLGGSVEGLIPRVVEEYLKRKFGYLHGT